MARTTMSHFLNKEIPITEYEDGLAIIEHATLKQEIRNLQPGVTYEYVPILATEKMAACQCIMKHAESGIVVTEVGESNDLNLTSEIGKQYPVTMATNRAFDRAAITLLQLEGKFYSSNEIDTAKKIKVHPMAETSNIKVSTGVPTANATSEPDPEVLDFPKVDGLTDETRILLGNCKGKTYGEVKNSPKFAQFLKWIAGQTPNYPDKNIQEQALLFLELSKAAS